MSNMLQEHPVMRHKKQGTAPAGEEFFQPVDGIDVQVVGGFIQQEQIRLVGQPARQQHTPLHPG